MNKVSGAESELLAPPAGEYEHGAHVWYVAGLPNGSYGSYGPDGVVLC